MTIEQLERKIRETEEYNAGALPPAIQVNMEMQRRQVLATLEVALQLAKFYDLFDARTTE